MLNFGQLKGPAANARTRQACFSLRGTPTVPSTSTCCRSLATAAAGRSGRDATDDQAPRTLRPRQPLFGAAAGSDERPSTSGRERGRERGQGGPYREERRSGDRSSRGRDYDEYGSRERDSGRRYSTGFRDSRRDEDRSERRDRGRDAEERSYSARRDERSSRSRGDGDWDDVSSEQRRSRREDAGQRTGRERGDGGERGGRGGDREGGRGRAERGADGPAPERRRSGSDKKATDAGAGASTSADAAAAAPRPGAPRPPGSSTGNRPLPYDLPIVRPYDGDKGTFFAGASWRQVGASEEVVAALNALGIRRPSHIQTQAYRTLLRPAASSGANTGIGSDAVALADQAGSGKTLAYLLPMLQLLREEEAAAGGRVTQPHCPRGIVLAPTVELVQQVVRVARAVSNAGLRFRSAAFTGGQADEKARAVSMRTQRDILKEGVDVLIATPGRLQKHMAAGNLKLDACKLLVLDEVDVLMGSHTDFLSQVGPLRAAAPPSLRSVLVSATLPAHVMEQLRGVWPGLAPVFGPGLHRTAAGLVEELVDCSGGEEVSEESGRKRKLEALQTLVDRHHSARTLVFCNKIDACRDVENFLKRADPKEQKYRVLPYHEAIRDDLRAEYLTEFLRPVGWGRPKEAQQHKGEPRAEQEGQQQQQQGAEGGEPAVILVATDRTSRGIDAPDCEHVVLFDFPRDPSEYVRRVGRTARGANGRGTVSSLVLGRQVPLAREIIERNQKGMPVHTVPM